MASATARVSQHERLARVRRPTWLLALALVLVALGSLRAQTPDTYPRRVVSVIPATTEMIFAMGAGDRLVGVGNFDRFPAAETGKLPRVGGLLDPDTERILSLKPDLVIVYNTQAELKSRLERAGVPYFPYEHRALPDVMETIRALGRRLGAQAAGERLASDMERSLFEVRRAVAGRGRPRSLLVFGREADNLRGIAASGGYGFLADLLDVAGSENVFTDIKQQSVQASTEMILARRPDVIIELRYGDDQRAYNIERELQPWQTLASVPAVRSKRIYLLAGDEFVVPGPRVVNAARRLAETIHPGAVSSGRQK
jgi:ABC-type Fe3+-hydroxamate transport system substrate-binding protein